MNLNESQMFSNRIIIMSLRCTRHCRIYDLYSCKILSVTICVNGCLFMLKLLNRFFMWVTIWCPYSWRYPQLSHTFYLDVLLFLMQNTPFPINLVHSLFKIMEFLKMVNQESLDLVITYFLWTQKYAILLCRGKYYSIYFALLRKLIFVGIEWI